MKINICLIFCLLVNIALCYNSERNLIVETAKILAPRFSSVKESLSATSSAKVKSSLKIRNKPHSFKVSIKVVKETDKAEDKPKDIQTMLNFEKDGIHLVRNKKTAKIISYTE